MKKSVGILLSVLASVLAAVPAGAATTVFSGITGHPGNSGVVPSWVTFQDTTLIVGGHSTLAWWTEVPVDGLQGVYSATASGACTGGPDFNIVAGRLVSYSSNGNVSQIGATSSNPCSGRITWTGSVNYPAITVPAGGTLQVQSSVGALNVGSTARLYQIVVSH